MANFSKADMRAVFDRGVYLGIALASVYDEKTICETFFLSALNRAKDAKAKKNLKDETDRLIEKWKQEGCPKEGYLYGDGKTRQSMMDFE